MKTKQAVYRVTLAKALAINRRVLRLVDGYLGKDDQESLRTDGKGLMTYGELRQYIKAALDLSTSPNPRRGRR